MKIKKSYCFTHKIPNGNDADGVSVYAGTVMSAKAVVPVFRNRER